MGLCLLAISGREWQGIQWAGCPGMVLANHTCVNLGGFHIVVPQQFLHRANIAPGLQQVGGKGITEGMTAYDS